MGVRLQISNLIKKMFSTIKKIMAVKPVKIKRSSQLKNKYHGTKIRTYWNCPLFHSLLKKIDDCPQNEKIEADPHIDPHIVFSQDISSLS